MRAFALLVSDVAGTLLCMLVVFIMLLCTPQVPGTRGFLYSAMRVVLQNVGRYGLCL